MIQEQIKLNESASLNRPAWSSMESTGRLQAFRHLHVGRKPEPIVKNFFDKSGVLLK